MGRDAASRPHTMELLHNDFVDIGGYSFHLIYGRHSHGYYIAIPNWGICVEAAEPDDVFYNSENLAACMDRTVAGNAQGIAEAIHARVPVRPWMYKGGD